VSISGISVAQAEARATEIPNRSINNYKKKSGGLYFFDLSEALLI
jgi:hypothetical protein